MHCCYIIQILQVGISLVVRHDGENWKQWVCAQTRWRNVARNVHVNLNKEAFDKLSENCCNKLNENFLLTHQWDQRCSENSWWSSRTTLTAPRSQREAFCYWNIQTEGFLSLKRITWICPSKQWKSERTGIKYSKHGHKRQYLLNKFSTKQYLALNMDLSINFTGCFWKNEIGLSIHFVNDVKVPKNYPKTRKCTISNQTFGGVIRTCFLEWFCSMVSWTYDWKVSAHRLLSLYIRSCNKNKSDNLYGPNTVRLPIYGHPE